jgi:hypothetical protein
LPRTALNTLKPCVVVHRYKAFASIVSNASHKDFDKEYPIPLNGVNNSSRRACCPGFDNQWRAAGILPIVHGSRALLMAQ